MFLCQKGRIYIIPVLLKVFRIGIQYNHAKILRIWPVPDLQRCPDEWIWMPIVPVHRQLISYTFPARKRKIT
jgi:hypothetical protein